MTVAAPTAAEAVAIALSGTISVTFDGQTAAHVFAPATVGPVDAGKPFALSVSGTDVTIAFEDMLGIEGHTPDNDYNDRTFTGVTSQRVDAPQVYREDYLSPLKTDSQGVEYHDYSASVTVTRQESGDDLWTYGLNNIRYYQHDDQGNRIDTFRVKFPGQTPARQVSSSDSWSWSLSEEFGDETISVDWAAAHDPAKWLMPGKSATFSFTTPAVPIVRGLIELDGDTADAAPMAAPDLEAFKLREVAFSGATHFEVSADPGDPAHPAGPQWFDGNTNSVVDIVGDRSIPVGYVRNGRVSVAAKWLINSAAGVTPSSVMVRADGPGRYDLDWTVATVLDNYLVLLETMLAVPLDNHVDYIEDFKLTWEVSSSIGVSPAGRSTVPLYATLDTPGIVAPIHRTVVHISTAAATGHVLRAAVREQTWREFADLDVRMAPPGETGGSRWRHRVGSAPAALLREVGHRSGHYAGVTFDTRRHVRQLGQALRRHACGPTPGHPNT